MKKLLLFTLIAFAGLTACKKKGCTDPNANNYNADAQKMMAHVLMILLLGMTLSFHLILQPTQLGPLTIFIF